MLNCWTKTTLLFACTLIVFPTLGEAQARVQQPGPTGSNPTTGQPYGTPRLTPEQQAAQQRAAMESAAQQKLAQENFSNQNQTGQNPDGTGAELLSTRQPEGFPLTAEHERYLGDLLSYWEQNSKRVEKYKCNFRRYEYDSQIVAYRDPQTNQLAAFSVAFGEIRFAAPERAKFETTTIMEFSKPPQKPGDQAEYKEREDKDVHERWICDGKSIFDFDFENKRMYETEIPEELQGNVAESPLPFMFGADKEEILKRYWIRSVTPRGVENEYWLEAFPKRVADSRMYSKIEIILAKDDFLPKAMHLYSPQYNPAKGNFESRYFMFENREVNGQLAKIQDFFGSFVRPRVSIITGWQTVKRKMGQDQAAVPPTSLPTPSERR
jgi:TIGR03009 family protein